MIEQRADTGTDEGQHVRRELRDTVDLICRTGGGVVIEEFPGALQEKSDAGEADASRARAARDPAVAGHHALLAVADALAETLAQLDAALPRGHA